MALRTGWHRDRGNTREVNAILAEQFRLQGQHRQVKKLLDELDKEN